MSTKAIEAVLNEYRVQITDSLDTELSRAQRQTEEHSLELINKALAEVAVIREAAKALNRLNVGDFTYTIKNNWRVQSETPAGASTWDHPDVKAWSDASVLMGEIAKESP